MQLSLAKKRSNNLLTIQSFTTPIEKVSVILASNATIFISRVVGGPANQSPEIEHELQSFHGITFRGQMSKDATATFTQSMASKLAPKPEILDKLIPDFPPACRRLTPGPGYLTALTKDNVDFITTEIANVTEEGVVTKDGITRAVDALVCATGFDTTWTGRFPIIGRKGRLLAEKWAEYPKTYIGVATDEFPNMFMSLGPSSAVGTGSLSIILERTGDYVCAAIQKMQQQAIRSIEVRPKAVDTFYEYSKAYFANTVFTLNCRSWYKGGTADGQVSALWPGEMRWASPLRQEI
jgi:cation diffusion facilitator CzcD-associated flavoprotein CzcO